MTDAAAPPALPFRRVLPVIAGIYITQSAIGGLTFHGVPAVLRQAGTALELIGLVSLFMLPWALKFLWAPPVERLRVRVDGGRRSRQIVLAGQLVTIGLVAGLALMEPTGAPAALLVVLALAAMITATVDTACDGYAIEQLTPATRNWGNTAQVGGGYLGAMAGGGLFLVLVGWQGWAVAALGLAGLLAVLTLPMASTPEPSRLPTEPGVPRPSLAGAWGRPAVRWGLAVILVYQAGLRLSQGMIPPFLVDSGFDLQLIGSASGVGGTLASLVGTVLAGLAIRRRNPETALGPAVLAQFLVLLGFVLAALSGAMSEEALVGLLLLKGFITGASFVVLYTAMMGWASLRQAGVDFALFQCADAGMAAIAGLGGGVLAGSLGYDACFGLSAGLALVAWIGLPTILRRVAGGLR